MTKAQSAALKAYPVSMESTPLGPVPVDVNEYARKKYQEGYEQAEKDLALTWEDMKIIHVISEDLWLPNMEDDRFIYKEVLRRFNELKSK